MAGSRSQSFWFSRSWVGPKNLHLDDTDMLIWGLLKNNWNGSVQSRKTLECPHQALHIRFYCVRNLKLTTERVNSVWSPNITESRYLQRRVMSSWIRLLSLTGVITTLYLISTWQSGLLSSWNIYLKRNRKPSGYWSYTDCYIVLLILEGWMTPTFKKKKKSGK